MKELTKDVCERARLSRDVRFDGRFYIGVTSTNIYCRPICPVQPPKAKNVIFFPTAAAAAESGFRPCLRCRPELTPGTPAWLGTSATVSRALRLIEKGVLDTGNLEDLAGNLGMGSRHLRRLFIQHLGAPPTTVAQTRRLHFAKRLIDETDLSMTEIAFASGYKSVRSFNYEFKKIYQRPPATLRKKTSPVSQDQNQGITVQIPVTLPLDWPGLLRYFATRAIPGIEGVKGDTYYRTFQHQEKSGCLSIAPGEKNNTLSLTIRFSETASLFTLVERAKQIVDAGAPLTEIAEHLGSDPLLSPLLNQNPGIRVAGAWDPFETAVRCILGQQISVKAASTLTGRLVQVCGTPLPETLLSEEKALTQLFPSPENLLEANLENTGITKTRIKTLRNFSQAIINKNISFDPSQDLDTFVERFIAIPGIGPWSAHAIAMRTLHDPDAFPASDLGIRKALEKQGKLMTEKELIQYAERWRPWRAYATMYLWKSLEP